MPPMDEGERSERLEDAVARVFPKALALINKDRADKGKPPLTMEDIDKGEVD